MRKNGTKLRKTEENMEKESNSNETDFSENEIPDLNSLGPFFEFEPKISIRDTNSSSSDDEEEGAAALQITVGHLSNC